MYADMSMIRLSAIPKTALQLELHLKICLMTGYALFAEQIRISLSLRHNPESMTGNF
jgi:hypothetical protein